MIRRLFRCGLVTALLAGVGCSEDKRPTIPTGPVAPLGPEKSAGSSGKKKVKEAADPDSSTDK